MTERGFHCSVLNILLHKFEQAMTKASFVDSSVQIEIPDEHRMFTLTKVVIVLPWSL